MIRGYMINRSDLSLHQGNDALQTDNARTTTEESRQVMPNLPASTTTTTPTKISLFLLLLLLSTPSSAAASTTAFNTLTPTSPLSDGQSLLSPSKTFALGFFTPTNSNSNRRYIGIWYRSIPNHTVIWVANRRNPLFTTNGTLSLTPNGTLLISNVNSSNLWSSNAGRAAINPVARLLDSGDFIVEDKDGFVWQSFDHPTDKLLPGMKLGWDISSGINRNLTSWASPYDPSPGQYSLFIDPRGYPQLVLADGSDWIWRGGPWNGLSFSGCPAEASAGATLGFERRFIWNEEEMSYMFDVVDKSVLSYVYADGTGVAARHLWLGNETRIGIDGGAQRWSLYWEAPQDPCDYTEVCGSYSICNANNIPLCSCLTGFKPSDPAGWALRDGAKGCKRMTKLDCTNGTDGFFVVNGAKLPDTAEATVNREWCLMNCSCTAYASTNVNVSAGGGGSGCLIWSGEVRDLRVFPDAGQNLFVRLAAADIPLTEERSPISSQTILEITICSVSVAALSIAVVFCIWKYRSKRRQKTSYLDDRVCKKVAAGETEIAELPLFDIDFIKAGTNHFSNDNKLGEGGFGPVYKGILYEGHEIAVKRLAKTSTQGINEFKNEVNLIAKLQHRNLVRLLGCCIEGEERLIIYEYMRNKSLDAFLFDKERSVLLDWETRYHIILGIARGLLYLHEDSRLKIIHRDLKASNILLDNEMNPKISDFGMARIFGRHETVVNTAKIVGTYGYMSPEYAMDGIFSVKSDVFSFGVLVLEIIAGRKNRGRYTIEQHSNLVGEAWSLWNEEKEVELLDDSIRNSISLIEVSKCIKLALLCVQEQAEDRPSMSYVVLMLCSDIASLPDPIQPYFLTPRHSIRWGELHPERRDWETSSDITSSFEGR
ncbi:G-type lectin S-receptor-like serine/threonine-protein kinase At4g27290 [Phalaenopsis equestris]|uniref:G-type lectin S-receptor-like serine/threonine-protein kinase At4g27290 n=1 Tax=Phalaenopsis equestris TaxID=78828 RepID=UPI0009E35615|nr:G-type lectin S-receptor-like serine/threonine-protein kinase At4g27290 [Phalaenopsis equestris]